MTVTDHLPWVAHGLTCDLTNKTLSQGFDDIAKNSEDKAKVKEGLEKMGAAR
jgi:hypothetical protein